MTSVLVMAVAFVAWSVSARRLDRLPLTAPMVFTTVGLAAAVVGVVDIPLHGEAAAVLIEATLIIVLFSDAVSVDLRSLRRNAWLPLRLLLVGLPLTLALGWVIATWLFPALSLLEAALLAAVLTPTDAALGQAVVTDRRLPERIREGLSVESGLNDGIMVPVIAVLLSLGAADAEETTALGAIGFAGQQIGVGVVVGIAAGMLVGREIHRRSLAGQISAVHRQLGTLATPVVAYAAASVLGGNGFIAAFVAGLAFGSMACAQCRDVADLTADDGALLTGVAFFVFGAAFLAPLLDEVTPSQIAYVAVSLTVARILPVVVALLRTPTLPETRVFVGWFGPRGLATILFILLIDRELDSAGVETVLATATIAVAVSVLVHGLTAAPWTGRLARRLATVDEPPGTPGPSVSHRTRPRPDRVARARHT